LKNWKVKSNDDLVDFLVKHYKLEASIDLYYLLATEKIELSGLKALLQKYVETDVPAKQREVLEPAKPSKDKPEERESSDILYIGDNLKNVDYRMAKCCNPIHGDKVFGFITTQGGITIHRNNCPNSKRLKEKYSYRVMDIKWITSGEESYSIANLRITGEDELGVVGEISKVISDDLRVNMRSINFQTSGKRFVGKVSVSVKDHDHLVQLMHKLNKVDGVNNVVRAK